MNLQDPRVHNLSRYSGIQSGGLSFLVQGTNFDSIQNPQFFIEYQNNRLYIEVSSFSNILFTFKIFQNCSVQTPETMLCFGPSFTWIQNETFLPNTTPIPSTIAHMINSRSFEKNHCQDFKFGFIMDDVEYVRNTSTYHETFLLCPDPIIYPFNNDGKRIQYRYDYLTIEGINLLDVATIYDYLITIGSYPCNISSISDQQIVCQPTNRTIEKLSRKKRDIHTNDNEQAIVRVSSSSFKLHYFEIK